MSMKRLDLNKPLETFAMFDILMALVFLSALLLGIWLLSLGSSWLALLGLFLLVGDGLIAYGVLVAPKLISVTHYKKTLVQQPTVWIKVAFLSDLHAHKRKPASWFLKLTERVKALKPDLMLMGGDYVVWEGKAASHLNPLAELEPAYGTYFVLGNHDYLDDPVAVRERLESFGWHDATNASLTLRLQGKELGLTGLDDPMFGEFVFSGARKSGVPHLTLAHSPDSVLDLSEGQTDLVLAGHAHGGQIRFPFIGSLFTPNRLGRKADQGEKIINGIRMIVSRGLGEVGVRARFMCRPEIVVIELGI